MTYPPRGSTGASFDLSTHDFRRVLVVSLALSLAPFGAAVLASYPTLAVGLGAGLLARPAARTVATGVARLRRSPTVRRRHASASTERR